MFSRTDEINRLLRLVLVDDHPLYRNGLKTALERTEWIKVVGDAATGKAAINIINKTKPDVVITDIRLEWEMDGLNLVRIINSTMPDVKILVLSAFGEENFLISAIEAGVDGYLLKDADSSDIKMAIQNVMDGGAVLCPSLTRMVFEKSAQFIKSATSKHIDYSGLTARENQIITLMKRGYTNRQISRELHISEKTVHNHTTNIYRKLNIHSRYEI